MSMYNSHKELTECIELYGMQFEIGWFAEKRKISFGKLCWREWCCNYGKHAVVS